MHLSCFLQSLFLSRKFVCRYLGPRRRAMVEKLISPNISSLACVLNVKEHTHFVLVQVYVLPV